MTFQQILDKYRQNAISERDKGDRFERLMQAYLQTDPKYAQRFSTVWLWNEFPAKDQLGGTDTGIDLVALTHENEYWAIQCKCYQADAYIDKAALDGFLATSGREFKDPTGQTTRFAQRLWISTSNRWSSNADEALKNQNPPAFRINLYDLSEARINWAKLEEGVHGEEARGPIKSLYDHQKEARDKVQAHFETEDRGQLIMACGTGKTFTSLRIAEQQTGGKGSVLFLVPSIALLGQTLREWSGDTLTGINAICICSDPEISKKKSKNADIDGLSTVDLAYPASTDPAYILKQFQDIKAGGKPGMTVVFSTYQSIEVIAKAQQNLLQNGFDPFDLIICDEAHRTTGVSLAGEDESAFVKVHDNDFVQARKRLYMTATPRLFSEDSQSKAARYNATLSSMDDPETYGSEIYRIGFGQAVEEGLLTDYKVLVLTLSDKDVPPAVQKMIAGQDSEINADDVSKIIGTINALSKQFLGDQGVTVATDPDPMRRAVAFCANIEASKNITNTYNTASEVYLSELPAKKREEMVTVEAQHMDGTMGAPQRDQMLGWLKEETENNTCRVITNVRVLSEGVDVPSLDSVLFLSARNSQVDVVQSVGRVMRRAEGKKFGYIVIPVIVPADVEAAQALDDNERYRVVWTVLNALRAHDDRFNATVNKIDLNHKRPDNIIVGRPETTFDEQGRATTQTDTETADKTREINRQLTLQFEQLQDVIFARMVKKVGDRRYWEDWAKEVAQIAERQIERIQYLITHQADKRKAFDAFLNGLQKNINPSITEAQAVEMLAQHIITKPIFEALFEGYSFTETNAVSMAMQQMLDALQERALSEDSDKLQKFYDSVKRNISDLDNAEAKQKIIIRIYDNFFKTAFPKMVEQLGIVYTPTEVVDFIIHSVEDVLQQEFGRSISDENVHVLDPFTGTGTFITRLLQSGLIDKKDLARKYRAELHANEIVLLAYYIAAVNIENAFHDQLKSALYDEGEGEIPYEAFEGIVLTDTFQLGETDDSEQLFSDSFPKNSARVERQKKAPLRVIMGNPPYSVGQKSANDNAQNLSYKKLDGDIAKTYAAATKATNKNSLYDSYIKAFRWSTDRLDTEHGGVIAFVSNGAWLDGNSADGFRKTIEQEFSSIWVFNLRGNARTQGELRQKEAGNVFGHGSRTPISITLLVKHPDEKTEKATIHYHDIGDYLDKDEKLRIIEDFHSVANAKMDWKILQPNDSGDWLNQRNDLFETFVPIGDKKGDESNQSFFVHFYSNGLKTQRDAWCYNSSKSALKNNIGMHFDFYNEQRVAYSKLDKPIKATDFLKIDSSKGSWTRALIWDLEKNRKHSIEDGVFVESYYRPFFKQNLYFSRALNEMVYQIPKLYPDPGKENVVICVSAHYKDGSVLIANQIPDLHFNGDTQAFPLYYYEKAETQNPGLFDQAKEEDGFVRKDGISDFILERALKQYGLKARGAIEKEDIFYYVYGLLHSPDYRQAFANDLKKMLPRLPLVDKVKDFWAFSKAGRKLADLHINYEEVPTHGTGTTVVVDRIPHESIEAAFDKKGLTDVTYKVQKMRFGKKKESVKGIGKTVADKSVIDYNAQITLTDIPAKAYAYQVNGKSAIEWIMERYQVKTDKKSGITNDPNDWADEVGKPRYILDLLLSVINLSLQTVDIVAGLPRLEFDTGQKEEAATPRYSEYSMVEATEAIGAVPAGTQGSIVMIHGDHEAYEVEFVVGDTSQVETVTPAQIKQA